MKRKILSLIVVILFCSLYASHAQITTETVSFDNYVSPTNNDFANRFTGGLGLTQITTNGITGGCLTTPNTVSWGNDNAIYCSKYIGANTWYAKTSVSFQYDSTQINSVNFDRSVSIFLRPNADFNHYVIASVTYDKKIQIVTYAWANSPPLLTLLQDHWYNFILTATFTGGIPGDQIDLVAAVTDLGLTGLDPPIPVNSSIGTINDSVLFGDSAIQVSFTGTSWGGAKLLDNFRFNGIKSADSCLTFPTNVPERSEEEFTFDIQHNAITFNNLSAVSNLTVDLYSVTGQKIYCDQFTERNSYFSISDFEPGVYLLRIGTGKLFTTKKFVIIR